MLKSKMNVFTLVLLFLGAIFFFGCQEEQSVLTPESNLTELSKYALPSNTTLVSATLNIYVSHPNSQVVNLHRITSPWLESTVTWANFGAAYDPTPELDNYTADAVGYKEVNVTPLVQSWVNGTYTDYGLLLDQAVLNSAYAHYHSSENSYPPYLRIYYSTSNGTTYVDVPAVEDAYIWELNPTTVYNTGYLYTGWFQNYEKQSLLKFDIEPTPDGGCTLTPGYWKTHSTYGPAPYDDNWENLGDKDGDGEFEYEDETFFGSEKSYYNVLWTSPRGNAYYNLSFHYIAAELNDLNGADFSAAQEAFDAATALFDVYSPAQIAAMKGNNPIRQQFISLAGILGNYNEGVIGPGHCDE